MLNSLLKKGNEGSTYKIIQFIQLGNKLVTQTKGKYMRSLFIKMLHTAKIRILKLSVLKLKPNILSK